MVMEALVSSNDTEDLAVDVHALARAQRAYTNLSAALEDELYEENEEVIKGDRFFANESEVRAYLKANNYDGCRLAQLLRSQATRVRTHSRHLYDADKLIVCNERTFTRVLDLMGQDFLAGKEVMAVSDEVSQLADIFVSQYEEFETLQDVDDWAERLATKITRPND